MATTTVAADTGETSPPSISRPSPAAERTRAAIMTIAVFSSGAVNLGMEMAASRVLAPFFGNSLTVWGSLIGVVLLGLAIGYQIGGRLADRHPTSGLLVAVMVFGSLSVLSIPLIDQWVLERIVSWDPGPSWNPLVASTILFVPPSIILACVSPIAVRLSAVQLTQMGRTAGRLFSVSTAGSIAGVFLTSFWLVPNFGTNQLLALGAASLLAVAAVLAFSEGLPKPAAAVVILTVVAALTASTLDTKVGDTLSRQEARDWSPQTRRAGRETGPETDYRGLTVRYRKDTQYHRLAVVDDVENGKRYLRFDSSYQSGMVLADPLATEFTYTDFFHLGRVYNPKATSVLLIGVGGGSSPKRMLADFPDTTIDIVDIDPEVIRVAREYFELPDDGPRLKSHVTDGRDFLKRSNQKWDVILMDAFYSDGIPFHMATSEYFDLLRSRLNPGGVVVMNAIGSVAGDDSKLFRSIFKTLQGVFPSVGVHRVIEDPSETPETIQNLEIVMTNDAPVVKSELARRYENLKDEFPSMPDLTKAIDDRYDLPVQVNDVPELTDDFAPTDALLLD